MGTRAPRLLVWEHREFQGRLVRGTTCAPLTCLMKNRQKDPIYLFYFVFMKKLVNTPQSRENGIRKPVTRFSNSGFASLDHV